MAISSLVVRSGIGSWGDIAHLITRGLDIGAFVAPVSLWTKQNPAGGIWSKQSSVISAWALASPLTSLWTKVLP